MNITDGQRWLTHMLYCSVKKESRLHMVLDNSIAAVLGDSSLPGSSHFLIRDGREPCAILRNVFILQPSQILSFAWGKGVIKPALEMGPQTNVLQKLVQIEIRHKREKVSKLSIRKVSPLSPCSCSRDLCLLRLSSRQTYLPIEKSGGLYCLTLYPLK